MKKKQITVKERVNILMRVGVDNPKAWMPIVDSIDFEDGPTGDDAWQSEYYKLVEHHRAESTFLFDVIRELLIRYDQLDEQFANTMADPSYEDD
jgi:hypothetical protein